MTYYISALRLGISSTEAICNFLEDDKRFKKWMLLILAAFGAYVLTPGVTFFVFRGVHEAPFSEELIKCLTATLSYSFGILYAIVFSIMEFVEYMKYYEMFEQFGHHNKYVVIRIAVVMSHWVYMAIHIYSIYKSRKSTTIIDKLCWRIGGPTFAVLCHMTWNTYIGPWMATQML